jgi:hypothetical protein
VFSGLNGVLGIVDLRKREIKNLYEEELSSLHSKLDVKLQIFIN